MSKETRFVFEEVSLTDEEAKASRRREIEAAAHEIRYLKNEVQQCEEYLKHLHKKPLDKTKTIQREVNPGDPGYDDAPSGLDVTEYQGGFIWLKEETGRPLYSALNTENQKTE
jgi:hypothetical protein